MVMKNVINPIGYQWFDLSKDDPAYIIEKVIKAEEKLNFYIKEVKSEYNLKNSKFVFQVLVKVV